MLHWKIRLRTTVKKNILDKKEREKKIQHYVQEKQKNKGKNKSKRLVKIRIM